MRVNEPGQRVLPFRVDDFYAGRTITISTFTAPGRLYQIAAQLEADADQLEKVARGNG